MFYQLLDVLRETILRHWSAEIPWSRGRCIYVAMQNVNQIKSIKLNNRAVFQDRRLILKKKWRSSLFFTCRYTCINVKTLVLFWSRRWDCGCEAGAEYMGCVGEGLWFKLVVSHTYVITYLMRKIQSDILNQYILQWGSWRKKVSFNELPWEDKKICWS